MFKKSLCLAYDERSHYLSIYENITGVIFMGTPHRGSDIASWTRFVRSLVSIPLLGNLRRDLLKDLEPNSKEIQSISAAFLEHGHVLKKIFSFYEQRKIAGVLVCYIVALALPC